MIEVLPPLEKYKYDTWRILPAKYYIDNSVRSWSCIQNVNKHFWHHCRGGSQYLLSVYRLHRIILLSIISLTDLSTTLVDVSFIAPQAHEIVNVTIHREYSLGIVFIFSQGRKDLYHV
jgi:hypothetical protein